MGKVKRLTAAVAVALALSVGVASLPVGEAFQPAVQVFLPTAEASTVSDLQGEYEELEEQLKDLEKELEELKDQKSSYMDQIENYNKQLELIEKQMEQAQEEKKQLEQQIEEAQQQIESLTGEIDVNFEQFKQRLKAFHLQGEASSLELLLSATNFTDFLTKYTVLESIAEHDLELMNNLKADREEVIATQEKLEQSKQEVETLEQRLEKKQKNYESLTEDSEKAVKELQKDEAAKKALMEEIDKAMEEVDRQIEEALKESEMGDYVEGKMLWPLASYKRISSHFNPNRVHPITGQIKAHTGTDISANRGTAIYAANSGKVSYVRNYDGGGYGKYCIIDHGGGIMTLYAHCDDVLVEKGDTVQKGDTIAKVGMTGTATGYHLHFEVRVDGEPVDSIANGWIVEPN